ncbi:mediator of RNA polymerase II transcription subunit 1-like [Ranitomeya variabilis]|uniref:mediator of RNA polymerase II transcription subunit 1-like n=1 Tax=Ranitomeya variabilis TaxID=490064 RepID=UPI004057A912
MKHCRATLAAAGMEAYVDLSEESMVASLWTPVILENSTVSLHAPVEYQQEKKTSDLAPVKLSSKALLEKLHLKYSQKPWIETYKLVRYCLEKPASATIKRLAEHPILRCTNTLQEAVKAKSLSTLLTRIESISKQKGLESHLGPNGRTCYITSEMFYIEVQVKKNGHVAFVKLAHHGESPMICKELLLLLRTKDFDGFGKSLEELLQLYSIPGNSDIKAKVYLSLCNLEEDMTALFNLSRSTSDNCRITIVLDGKVGFISPRSGGTPMNIEYYITPQQIWEEKRTPGSRVVGSHVSVTIAGTTNWYHLPMGSLFQESPQGDGSMDGLSTLTDESCISLPGCFFLRFDHLEPVLLPLIQKIQNITGLTVVSTKQSLFHELIIETKQKPFADLVGQEVQFIVSLSGGEDQCFVLNSRLDNENIVIGALVKKIPFIDPNHVPSILEVLRHQAAYNTLLSSCISSTINPNDHTDMLHFEVSLQKDLRICISFQHPNGGSLSCVVVDVLSHRKLMCSLYTNPSDPPSPCNTEFIMKVLESCMSIPLTMRAIFRKMQEIKGSENMDIICATMNNILPPLCSEYQKEAEIEQPHDDITQDAGPSFTNIPNNEDYDLNEGVLTIVKKTQEMKASKHMEIKCAIMDNEYQEEAEIDQPHDMGQDAGPTFTNIPKNEDYDKNEGILTIFKKTHQIKASKHMEIKCATMDNGYQEEAEIEQPHDMGQNAGPTFTNIPKNEDYDNNEGMLTIFKKTQEIKASTHMEIKCATMDNEYQEEAEIEQPHDMAQDAGPTFTNIPKNEDNDNNEVMLTIFKKTQEIKASKHMEIKCATKDNEHHEEAEIEQRHDMAQDAGPTFTNIPNNEDYDHNEGIFHDDEDGGSVHSGDLHGSSSSQTVELNSSYTGEDLYYHHSEISSSLIEEHNSSVVEESYSSVSEEPSSSIIQELSPIMHEVSSSNEAEDPNSSIADDLSLSITEELNSSVSGVVVQGCMSEHEMDDSC